MPTETSPSLSHLRLNLDGYDNPPRYSWPVNDQALNSDRIRLQLIEKAIHLLNTQKQETKPNVINDCFNRQESLVNTLNCVKDLVKRHRRNQNHIPKHSKHYQYNIKKDFNEYDSDETDLSKANLYKSFNSRSNFSQDYLDVADLLRTDDLNKDVKDKKIYVLKSAKQKNKYGRFDYDLSRFRKSNSIGVKKSLRSDFNSDYSASGSQEDDGMREEPHGYKERKDKYDIDSSEVSSEEIQIKKLKPKKFPRKKAIPKRKPQILYMQGPSRLYREDGRRRLPYFFPKRLHWNEDDVKNLRDYWINGPQGKYSGYRIAY
ncbi:uncharacterized protein LOC124542125 [Vanessa cardui]|uniref:uncharacterized protein LOC124542125 n=1 Tax=Vanessa cardui TaxID=171605 RepID=UPI001F13F01D|nr:uncharacterized protein LOC124542125 [Vanessa cardui]